jgi:hypothetical protein
MSVVFKLIRLDKDISEKENFGIRLLSSLFIVGVGILLIKVSFIPPIIVTPIVIILVPFARQLERKIFSNWVRRKDIIGELIFDEVSITWKDSEQMTRVPYVEIVSIDLRYNYIKGRRYAIRDFIHNGLSQMEVGTTKGKTETIKFLIEKEAQFNDLKPIWKSLYKMGVKIREKMGEVELKTILFDRGMSYDQIKKLKKELNVDSFY